MGMRFKRKADKEMSASYKSTDIYKLRKQCNKFLENRFKGVSLSARVIEGKFMCGHSAEVDNQAKVKSGITCKTCMARLIRKKIFQSRGVA